MKIFKNPNYDFVRWTWHALALSWVDHPGRRSLRLEERDPAGRRVLRRHDRGHRLRADARSRQDPRRAAGRRRQRRSCRATAPPAQNQVMVRVPDARRGVGRLRSARRPKRCVASIEQGRARADQRHVRAAEAGNCIVGTADRRADRRQGAGAARHPRDGLRARRHPRLHRAALPRQLRRRRGRRDAARPADHVGVPGRLPVRAEPQRHRGAADDHRLLDERHHRHLRPRPREHAHRCAATASRRSSTPRSTRCWTARSSPAARRCWPCTALYLLRRRSAQGLRLHDDRRHHHRHLLERVHRLGDRRAVAAARHAAKTAPAAPVAPTAPAKKSGKRARAS